MTASATEHEARHTTLYAHLMTQWARQTAQYSRSVRLYQELVGSRRAHRRRALGQTAQPDPMPTPRPTPLAILEAPDEVVSRPSLELVIPPPSARAEERQANGKCPLTARQREIAELIAQGLTNSQIATKIVVSRGTVGNHIGHMLRRLGVKNRVQIAAWAIQHTSKELSVDGERE